MFFGCKCLYWIKRVADVSQPKLEAFSLPSALPQWPQGQGFASGRIDLGNLEVIKITTFELITGCNLADEKNGVSFLKPVGITNGFFCLGYYCHPNDRPLRGYVLAARDLALNDQGADNPVASSLPALRKPLEYSLVWTSNDETEEFINYDGCSYIWLPQPPEGYKTLGYVVTNNPNKPELDAMRCVRADLTDCCETKAMLFSTTTKFPKFPFRIWSTRPNDCGMSGKGVSVGTFFCSGFWSSGEELYVACLKNLNPSLHAMPNLDQVHALINQYGPTVYFHPDEVYLPSSVPWFFQSGALLYKSGGTEVEFIDSSGSNLPSGGTNDGEYWIDLPNDEKGTSIKCGNLGSAKLYVHVKPALGGTFTDVVMWVFCPFNGPATLKVGLTNMSFTRIGQHVGDWEHFTLRISNFTGELWSIYFSQHSGGEWVDAHDLEFVEGNRAIVYSSRHGHASYPHAGSYLQGSSKLGIGVRNDAASSNLFLDSSKNYEIIAAEYLGDGVVNEPRWLQYMREWGPTIVYDARTELDKIFNLLPVTMRYSVENLFNSLPMELYGEEGPTGPKEKNNWMGDERS